MALRGPGTRVVDLGDRMLLPGFSDAHARYTATEPAPRGGRIELDAAGELTGVFHGRAGERFADLVPPWNLEQSVAGARVALRDLASVGITSIHDVARLEAVSQRALLHAHVERSGTDLELFRE